MAGSCLHRARAAALAGVACALALLLVALAAGCARPPSGPDAPLVVFAASSLREAFSDLRAGFVAEHPGARVEFAFAGSQELRAQLERGAGADVIAAADEETNAALAAQGLVDAPVVFASNEPVVVVSTTANEGLRTLADLPSARRIVLGVAAVPIGRYADATLAAAGPDFRRAVEARVVSREFNARQVLAKVRLGEADAAIVYRTDARAAPELRVVEIPADLRPAARCSMAVVRKATVRPLAAAWVRHALSEAGQGTLRRAGLVDAAVLR
jgi:molybdate transport system substrate-binding protein